MDERLRLGAYMAIPAILFGSIAELGTGDVGQTIGWTFGGLLTGLGIWVGPTIVNSTIGNRN